MKKHALTTWDPFRELDDIQNRLSSLFRRENGGGEIASGSTIGAEWSPAVDIAEDDNEFLITADLPEVDKKDIKVTMDDGILRISGERHHESEEKDEKKKYHRIERSHGHYERSFRMPKTVDGEKLAADFKDGVLHVHLPKSEESKPKEIEVAIS